MQERERFESGCAWVDGEYVALTEARIPIIDMGFLRCDATYDVVSVWNSRFFRLEDHLDRFEAGWKSLHMSPSLSRDGMKDILVGCVLRTGLENAYVAMILTRGVALPGVRDPRVMENRFYAYAAPFVWIFKPEDQELGAHLVVCRETIRIPSRAVDPRVKNFHWGDMVGGLFEAYQRGGQTVVLADSDGNISEGPGFNIFAYSNDVLLTPASGVLEGITRRTVLELAAELGIAAREDLFGVEVLRSAAEIFLTSTAGGIMPVTTLDGRKVGRGRPGPVTSRLRRRYWEVHDEESWTTPVV